jgi:hypothetical protein
MLIFSTARKRALLHIYDIHRRCEGDRRRAEIAEHAIDLALSERRADAYLVRSVMRNSKHTVLTRLKRETARAAHPPANDNADAAASLDAMMAKDDLCKAAQPPSPEHDVLMRDAFSKLLDVVERRLGADGAEVMRRFEDPVEEVARDLGCSADRVKVLRRGVREIALPMKGHIFP